MRVLNKEELEQDKPKLLKSLKKSVFVYPTDSIYGLGCDATNPDLVQQVREAKNSTLQPFSVIAPSKDWITENCEVPPHAKDWIDQLGSLIEIDGEPKAVSLILKLKDKDAVAPNVTQGKDTISVRIPDHWFSDFVAEMGVPVITTSANPTGGDFMTSTDNLHPRVKQHAHYCIYEGEKQGNPSTLVHLNQEAVDIKQR